MHISSSNLKYMVGSWISSPSENEIKYYISAIDQLFFTK